MMINLVLLLTAAGYLAGVRRNAGRIPSMRRGVQVVGRLRVIAFLAGLVTVGATLSLPLADSADDTLWADVGKRMILIVTAAPLLAAGGPAVPFLLLLPHGARRRVSRFRAWLRGAPGLRLLYRPVTAWLVSVCVLFFWQIPALHTASVDHELLYGVQQLSTLAAFWAFWWHVLRADGEELSGTAAVRYVLAAMLPSSALAAALTFARSPLYAVQAHAEFRAGHDPLADQQVAGLITWIPPDLLYLAIAASLFLRWFAPIVATSEEFADLDSPTAVVPAIGPGEES